MNKNIIEVLRTMNRISNISDGCSSSWLTLKDEYENDLYKMRDIREMIEDFIFSWKDETENYINNPHYKEVSQLLIRFDKYNV